MTIAPAPRLADRYERDVLPRVIEQLDDAFPEFGFVRDPNGWRTTNNETTHALLGCRADRVVCDGDAPRGILIHGHGPFEPSIADQDRPRLGLQRHEHGPKDYE